MYKIIVILNFFQKSFWLFCLKRTLDTSKDAKYECKVNATSFRSIRLPGA